MPVRPTSILASVCSVLVAATFLLPPNAWAQIEEIVVTVRKKEENLQDVPISVSVFSVGDIERKGIRNIANIARLTPSIQFNESFAQSDTRVAVRGLSPTRGRQNLAFLVDGIDVSSEAISSSGGSLLINTRLIDIERIEIVLGPQMALYGRSAFNGAIQYITKDPSEQLETELKFDVADYNRYNATGSISAPVFGDALGFRLNGSWWDEGGFYENSITNAKIGGEKGFGLALTLKSEIGDNISLKFRTEYTDDEGSPSPQAFLPFNAEAAVPVNATEFTNIPQPDGTMLDGAGISECFNGQNGKPNFIGAISADNGNAPTNDEDLQARSDRIMDPNFMNLVPGSDLALFLGMPIDGGLADPPPTAGISPYCEWVVPLRVGQIPDADELVVTLAPDPGTPGRDYPGFDRELLRISLVAAWELDNYTLTSLTGFTRDDTAEAQDAGAFAFLSSAAGPFLDGNVNTFTSATFRETEQFNQEIRFATNFDGRWNGTIGGLYWNEDVDTQSTAITAQASGSHCMWNSQLAGGTTNPIDIDDGCTGYTETPVAPYQNAATAFRTSNPVNRETEHWSIYGMLDFDLSDTWTLSLEGRWNNEDVTVEGPVFYDPGASGGPGGLNPCGIFFRGCQPFMDWLDGGNWFGDAFFPYTDADFDHVDFTTPPEFIIDQVVLDAIPQKCWSGAHTDITQAPAAVQRSILEGPFEVETEINSLGQLVPVVGPGGQPIAVLDANGRAVQNPAGTDMFNPWCVDSLKDSDDWFSPKINLDWQVTDNALAYFTWSRARKPGGFSLLTVGSSGLNRDLTEFAPEKMEVWETGAKTAWLDNTLIVNGAFFFQDFTDKQALTSALGNDGRLVSKVENAGAAEVWGAELSVQWSPETEFLGGRWSLNGAYTWLDTEYTDFTVQSGSSTNAAAAGNCTPTVIGAEFVDTTLIGPETLCTLSYTGNELENAPPGAFNGFVNFTIPMTAEVDAYIESDFIWQDSRFTNLTNNIWTDAYWNFDLRVGLNSDRWEALLYVDNVLDNDTVQMSGGGPGLSCCFVLGSSIDLAATGDYTQAVPTEGPDAGAGHSVHLPRSAGAAVMVDLPLFSTGFLPPPRVVGFRWTYRFGG